MSSRSLVFAGAVAFMRRAGRVGLLMFAAGLAWLLAGLRWSDTSSVLQTSGLAVAWLWAAVLAQLALAFPSGRLTGTAERALVVAAYIIAVPVRLTERLQPSAAPGVLAYGLCRDPRVDDLDRHRARQERRV